MAKGKRTVATTNFNNAGISDLCGPATKDQTSKCTAVGGSWARVELTMAGRGLSAWVLGTTFLLLGGLSTIDVETISIVGDFISEEDPRVPKVSRGGGDEVHDGVLDVYYINLRRRPDRKVWSTYIRPRNALQRFDSIESNQSVGDAPFYL